jgi:hypothetical protein
VTPSGVIDATSRLRKERCEVGRDEVLAFAETDDHRRLVPHADEVVRMVVMDHDEREVPFEMAVGIAHGCDEIAVVGVLEQVRNDFGVRLGGELVPGLLQVEAKLAVVLDDPVEHDRHLAVVAGGERMCVLLGDAAVRRPAGVAEAGRRGGDVRLRSVLQELEVPDRADVLESPLFEECDAGRVVAAIFEAREPLQQQRPRGSTTDVSNDPAHPEPPSLPGRLPEIAREKSPENTKARLRARPCIGAEN